MHGQQQLGMYIRYMLADALVHDSEEFATTIDNMWKMQYRQSTTKLETLSDTFLFRSPAIRIY